MKQGADWIAGLEREALAFEVAASSASGIQDLLLIQRCGWTWMRQWAEILAGVEASCEEALGVLSYWQRCDTELAFVAEQLANTGCLHSSLVTGQTNELCAAWRISTSHGIQIPGSAGECQRLFEFSRRALGFANTQVFSQFCAGEARLHLVGQLVASLLAEPALLAAASKEFQPDFERLPLEVNARRQASQLSSTLRVDRPIGGAVSVDLMAVFLDAQQRLAREIVRAMEGRPAQAIPRAIAVVDGILAFCTSREILPLPDAGVSKPSEAFNLRSLVAALREGESRVGRLGGGLVTATHLGRRGRTGERWMFVIWHSSPDLFVLDPTAEQRKKYQDDPVGFALENAEGLEGSRVVQTWRDDRASQVLELAQCLRDKRVAAFAKSVAEAGAVFLTTMAAGHPSAGQLLGGLAGMAPAIASASAAVLIYFLGRKTTSTD